MSPTSPELEARTLEIGHRLYQEAGRHKPRFFGSRGLRGYILRQVLADLPLRNALFQFIDTLPQLEQGADVAAHFRSYLAGHRLPGVWGRLLALGNLTMAAWAVRNSVERIGRLFLVEEEPAKFERVLREIQRVPALLTVDAVGEAVLSEEEADQYAARYSKLLTWEQAAGVTPHISLKLSGLTPRFDVLDATGTLARVRRRLQPLIAQIHQTHAGLTIDMEDYELRALTLQLFYALVEEDTDSTWRPGIAVQAYLADTERDLMELVEWARRIGRRISVRLVKGAYWDTEVALAIQREWPVPVYLDKSQTDANYENLTRLLFEHSDVIYPAIAGHNLRSIAHAVALAGEYGISPDDWEVQMLYGMADPLQRAVAGLGINLRVYLPSGDLVIGIAYLIRRLLENTASTSILRQTYAEKSDVDALLAPPSSSTSTAPSAGQPSAAFVNTPLLDFSRADAREALQRGLAAAHERLGADYPLAIHGATTRSGAINTAVNPADPAQILGRVELAQRGHAEQAVRNAVAAFPAWRDTPVAERCRLCLRAADLLAEKRTELAAWEILEQGKNWREADADVAEAIDYLRYYAHEAAKLDGWQATHSFPAETNELRYEPRGVALIVAPWNFPLALLVGMTTAALVAGNCAIMKPSASAQIVAHRFMQLVAQTGFPADVCQLLAGRGEAVGDFLVEHPRVDVIAFTGSRDVGLAINEKASRLAPDQKHVKRVVCEMGGKNAVIVDADADLDEAVTHILHSAFGYQGQKCSACSRVIALAAVHDRLVARLAAALDAYSYGPPEDPQFVFGPVISQSAQQKVHAYIEIGRSEGRLYYLGRVPTAGFYVPPAIFTEIKPHHRLAQEEIFGPLLSVLRADTFENAIAIALDSDYALTGGVFSRLPEHLAFARDRFHVGNLYLNRGTTGARVGVQPFGGIKLSGTGIQAGGADYIKQFMWTRVVSENTMRHGLVPI